MGGMDSAGRPVLTLGAKGFAYIELTVRSLESAQHTALGGLAPNAAWRLTWALSTLKSPDETIIIDGFSERVVPPSEAVLSLLRNIPFDEESRLAHIGITHWVGGLSGLDVLRRFYLEPTCTICAIDSGQFVEAQSAILPAVARAAVEFRLVPNLTPEVVTTLLREHLANHGFSDVDLSESIGEPPDECDMRAEVVQAAIAAARRIDPEAEPLIYPRLSASPGPIWSVTGAHQVPVISFGAANPGSNLHSANENVRLDDYFQSMRMMCWFIAAFGGVQVM